MKVDYFQQNVLCNELHNDKNIWYSKIEFLNEDLQIISKLENNVTLIVGNSDASFSDLHLKLMPPNVKSIFASNCLCVDNNYVFSLPLGIESLITSKRKGHGIAFSFAKEKQDNFLKINKSDNKTSNLIYSNFSVSTNYAIRADINDKIKNCNHVTVQEERLSFDEYYKELTQHEAAICPIGNGLDTVRTYECFYCNVIPIIYGSDIIYKNHLHDMPCIYIKSLDEIKDFDHIKKKVEEAKNKKNNIEKAYLDYWIKLIRETTKINE